MIHTQYQGGKTYICGGIFATKTHHARIISSILIHQGCQRTDTRNQKSWNKKPFHDRREPITGHWKIGTNIQHHATGENPYFIVTYGSANYFTYAGDSHSTTTEGERDSYTTDGDDI